MPPALASPSGHRKQGGERNQEKAGTRMGEKTPEKAKNVSHVPCKFFRQSMCQAGDKCPFSHELEADVQAICKYFQKGNCKFGSKCALAHITPDGWQVNKKAGRDVSRRRERHRDDKRLEKHFKDPENEHAGAEQSHNLSRSAPNTVNAPGSPPSYTHASETSADMPQQHFGSRASFSQTSDTSNADSSVELASRILSKYSGTGSPPNKAFQAFGMRSLSMGLPRRSSANWVSCNIGSNLAGLAEGSAILDDEDDFIAKGNNNPESDEEEGYTEQLVPSALQDLLTPIERERRNSRTLHQKLGRVNSSPASAAGAVPASLSLLAFMASPTSAPAHPVGYSTRRGSTSSETMTGQSSLWTPRNTAAPFCKQGPYGSPPIPAASLISLHPLQLGEIVSSESPRQVVSHAAHPANYEYASTPIGSGTTGEFSFSSVKSPTAGRYNNFAIPITSGNPDNNSSYRPFQQYHSIVHAEKF